MIAASARLQRLRRSIRGAAGIARSLRIYYGSRAHRRRMIGLYRTFAGAGDLVFDIGSHVGDRIGAFRAIGARVVAVEPQPAAFRWLKFRYGRDPMVTLLQAAASDAGGTLSLHLNLANPTVSTASDHFIAAAREAPGWQGQNWDQIISVPALTLDALIARFGEPAFVKIDVEGLELNVLRGLSQAPRGLSFEFTTIQREVAHACLDRLAGLGPYAFNAALGESQLLAFPAPVGADEMATFIDTLPQSANSGDIYAVLTGSNAAFPESVIASE
jgi:FkbM family methyltransferase